MYWFSKLIIPQVRKTDNKEEDSLFMQMTEDVELALQYSPVIFFDVNETIFPRAVGVTRFTCRKQSLSFPKRWIDVPEDAAFVMEYAYYYDYDIEHMYDLEHIWVTVGKDGKTKSAEGSFHGKYLNLLVPEISGSLPLRNERVQAFCQPGKHAFLPAAELFRLVPRWRECCLEAGGPVLIGNPFCAEYAPGGKDLFIPKERDDRHSIRYLRENLSFRPKLQFREKTLDAALYRPWGELFSQIPDWISRECRRLDELYGKE